MNRAVEKLDIESIDAEPHGGVNFDHLQVQESASGEAMCGLRGIGEVSHP